MKEPIGRNAAPALILSSLVFVALIYFSGTNEVLSSFSLFSPQDFLLLLLLAAIPFAIRIVRWGYLLESSDVRVPYGTLVVPFVVSNAVSLVTPGRTGNVIRCVLLKCRRASGVLSSVIVEAFLEMSLLTVVAYSFLLKYSEGAAIVVTVLVLALIFAVFAIRERRVLRLFWGWLCRYLPLEKYRSSIFRNYMILKKMYLKPATYKAVLLTVAAVSVDFFRIFVIFSILNHPFDFLTIAQIVSAAIVISCISMIPGGFVSFEASLLFFFSLFGVPLYIVSSVIIVERLLTYWIPLTLGIVLVPKAV